MNPQELIDVNVCLGRWPFLAWPQRTAALLDAHLASEGITQAWVSSIEALLDPDVDGCDGELFAQLQPFPRLRPVKTIQLLYSNWPDAFRKAIDQQAVAIKLHPTYHQFKLDDPQVGRLVELAIRHNKPVLVQLRVDDERNQHPVVKAPGVPIKDAVELARKFTQARIAALGAYHHEIQTIAGDDVQLQVDLSMAETSITLSALVHLVSARRVLFGSHTPMLYTRSAVLKWKSAPVDEPTRQLVAAGNARRLSGQE